MQTFLPYPDYVLSATVLDNKRLGKQRVECLQLLKGSFPNHPAAKMWKGYEYQLYLYGVAICAEWSGNRGFNDTVEQQLDKIAINLPVTDPPPWMGGPIHLSHKSNLVRKSDYYRALWPDVPNNIPYFWPVT